LVSEAEGKMLDRLPEYTFSIDVPSGLEVMASGKLQDEFEKGDRKIFKWRNYQGLTDRSLYFFAARSRG